jgi:hypothetical protein
LQNNKNQDSVSFEEDWKSSAQISKTWMKEQNITQHCTGRGEHVQNSEYLQGSEENQSILKFPSHGG